MPLVGATGYEVAGADKLQWQSEAGVSTPFLTNTESSFIRRPSRAVLLGTVLINLALVNSDWFGSGRQGNTEPTPTDFSLETRARLEALSVLTTDSKCVCELSTSSKTY